MANFLTALLQGLSGTDPNEIEGINVTAPGPPPVHNPYTPSYIQAAQQASQSQGQLPRVSGGTDRGLYGLLPQGVRNGRLRDVLGAIGDGILMGAGQNAQYQPRVDERTMGQALLGYNQQPGPAIERLAQTGVPDSVKGAETMFNNLQTVEAKRAAQAELEDYRKQQMGYRTDQTIQRVAAIVPGVLARAKTPEDYASAYARLDQVVKRISPDSDPTTAWGLPTPDDWTPEMTAWTGTTGGQQVGADVRRESIQQRRESAGQASADRRAGIAQRAASANVSHEDRQASIAQRREAASQRAKTKAGGGGGLHTRNPGVTKPGGLTVTNGDVAYLKAHPDQRANFDKHFGTGSALKYLGK